MSATEQVTANEDQQPKPLPDIIPLKVSQQIAINKLANDEQQLNQQMAQVQNLIRATHEARARILAEIESEHNLEPGTVGNLYQCDGQQLIKA